MHQCTVHCIALHLWRRSRRYSTLECISAQQRVVGKVQAMVGECAVIFVPAAKNRFARTPSLQHPSVTVDWQQLLTGHHMYIFEKPPLPRSLYGLKVLKSRKLAGLNFSSELHTKISKLRKQISFFFFTFLKFNYFNWSHLSTIINWSSLCFSSL